MLMPFWYLIPVRPLKSNCFSHHYEPPLQKDPVIHFGFITVCRLSFSKRFFLMTLLELLCKLLVIVLAFRGKNFVYPNLFPSCLSHSCSPLSVLDCILQFLCLTRSCRDHSGICLQLCLSFLHSRLVGNLRRRTGCNVHHPSPAPVVSLLSFIKL